MANFDCIKTMSTNNFLLETNNGYLLIDAGMGRNYQTFLRKFQRMNVDIKKIEYIFLTHHHSDHTAFLSDFLKDTEAKLIVHKKEVSNLEEGRNIIGQYKKNVLFNVLNKTLKKIINNTFTLVSRPGCPSNSILKKIINDTFTPVKVRSEDIIIEGDDTELLKSIGIDGVILHTPGHTDGSLSIVMSDGTAFVGDTVMNFILSSPNPFVFQSMEEVFKSWEKLHQNGAKTLYPAHGKPIDITQVLSYRDSHIE